MKTKGYVLTELLVVLVIVGILCAVAIPIVQNITTWSLRTAAHEMAAMMREARQTALSSGEVCYVIFYGNFNRYVLETPDGLRRVDLPEGIIIGANNFPNFVGRPTVYFRYTGAPNRGGHVALQNEKGQRMYVIVTPVTGRVRISNSPP